MRKVGIAVILVAAVVAALLLTGAAPHNGAVVTPQWGSTDHAYQYVRGKWNGSSVYLYEKPVWIAIYVNGSPYYGTCVGQDWLRRFWKYQWAQDIPVKRNYTQTAKFSFGTKTHSVYMGSSLTGNWYKLKDWTAQP